MAILQHADGIFAQYGFRRRDIEDFLAQHGIAVSELDAIVSRGGPTAPVEGGTYRIDEDMLAEIRTGKYGIHPCSLGCQIAYDMTAGTKAAALTVDKVQKATEGMQIVKTILVKNRLINLIVKPQ